MILTQAGKLHSIVSLDDISILRIVELHDLNSRLIKRFINKGSKLVNWCKQFPLVGHLQNSLF